MATLRTTAAAARYTAVFESADPILVADADGRYVDANPAALALLGYSEEELLQVGVGDVSARTPEGLQDERRRLVHEGSWWGQSAFRRKDGSVLPVEVRASQAVLPEGTLSIISFHDLTEHKRSEAVRLAGARQFALVTDNAPVFIAHCDTDQRYKFVNTAYAARFGLPPAECVGRTIREVVGAEAYASFQIYLDIALSGQAVAFDIAYSATDRHHMRCSYVPEFDADGNSLGFVAANTDITAHRRTEEALRASEARQGFLLALSDQLRPLSDARAVMTTVAEALGRHLGVSAVGYCEVDEDEETAVAGGEYGDGRMPRLVGSGYRFRISDYGPNWGSVLRAGEDLYIEDIETDSRGPAGGTAESRATVLRAGAGVPLIKGGRLVSFLYAVHPDPRPWPDEERRLVREVAERTREAVERARAEATLRESEARYRTLVRASANGVWRMSADGERLLESQGGVVKPHELAQGPTAKWLDTSTHPEDREATLVAWRHAVQTRSVYDHRQRVRSSKGDYRWVQGHAAPVPDEHGTVREWIGTSTDITDRVDAEATTARLAAIVETSQDAISSETLDGTILDWNPGAEALFGYSAAEAIGRNIQLLIPPERTAETRECLAQLRDGELLQLLETVRLRKDRTRVEVEVRFAITRDANGHINGISTITRDITERKHLERLRQDVLAIVSHDLRNPLAVIGMQTQLLQGRQAYDEAGVGVIREQVRRMTHLIDDLSDVVRLDEGQFLLRQEELDLGILATEAVLRAGVQTDRHTIRVELPENPVMGYWDRVRLEEVLDNLVGNAVKYSPAGGEILVQVAGADGEAHLSVTDHGVGVPTEALPQLFERFRRADGTGLPGLGFGLYIARMLVEAHGGRILVESEFGRGSTFTVVLPILRGSEIPAGPAQNVRGDY